MNPLSSMPSSSQQVISIARGDRWEVCRRLQELDIACNCLADGSCAAEIHTPLAAIQLWSVISHLTSSRQQKIGFLHQCLQNG